MKRLGINILLSVVCLVVTLTAFAQGATTFTTNAPMRVAVGETFRIEFALNAKPDKDDSFVAPAFNGFDVIAGPAISRGSSVQIINGSMTKSVNYTFTYVVVANTAGTNTIGAASVIVDGKKVSTKPLPLEVISETAASAQSSAQGSAEQGDRIAEDDVLLRTVVSRTSLFKGEPLHVTIKLYSRVAIAGAENEKMPSFNGFWSQDIKGNNRGDVQRETYNGKVYDTQVLYDYLLYPQQSGKLTIDPASMTVVAQLRVRSRNTDPFFGGGYEIVNVRRNIASKQITVDVKELPAGAPASFSGAVGQFSMDSSLSAESVAANSSLSYVVRIAGTGNLSLIQSPALALPSTFEQYNVKTTESITTNKNGATGYKQFEYPIIPRSEGDFEVQPTKFSFFNTRSMKYETLEAPIYNLEILPDSTSTSSSSATVRRSLSREDVRLLGEDIRFIKIESAALRRENTPFILSRGYYALLVSIFALFAALYLILRRYIKESQNSTLVRGKRANKVAVQRFKAAGAFMKSSNERAFYTEVLSALWGYMSDKFNIPVANLTKESVRKELARRSVQQELIEEFAQIITLCDEAQYSPMASAQMNEVYLGAIKLISRIETEIKR